MSAERDRPSDEEIRRVYAWEHSERERKQREYREERERRAADELARWERETNALLLGKRIAAWEIFINEITLTFDDGSVVELAWDDEERSFSVTAGDATR